MAKSMAFLCGMLLVTLLAACNGGGEGAQPTPTPTSSPPSTAPTSTPAPEASPTPEVRLCVSITSQCEAQVTNVAPQRLNIRNAPTALAEIIGKLSEGEVVCLAGASIFADGFHWWPVRSQSGVVGWVAQGDPEEPDRPWLTPTDQKCGETTAEPPPTRIFFKRGNELWSVNPDGSNPLRLASEVLNVYRGSSVGSGTKFMPSRHGDRVAFTGTDRNLWIIDSTGENLKRYSEEALPNDETYYGTSVAISGWSPDGTKIIYSVESVFGLLEKERERPEVGLYFVELTTGKRTRIPNLPNFVAWTSDPEKVIFETKNNGDSSVDWYTLDLSTGATAKLTVLPFQCFSVQASVHFDANRLMYSCGNLQGRNEIIIANIDNTDQQVLIEGRWAELQFPVLSPSGESFIYHHQSQVVSGGIVIIDIELFNLQTGQKKILAIGCTRARGWLDNHSVIVVKAESEACVGSDANLYLIDATSGARTTLANDGDFD